MSLVWGFDLNLVADRVRYRDEIADTATPYEVAAAIEALRDHLPLRVRHGFMWESTPDRSGAG